MVILMIAVISTLKERWKLIFPQKLKYRLFLAFVVLILLPFSLLTIYNFRTFEDLIQTKISEQSHEQLGSLQKALQDQMSIAFNTLLFLEQDSTVRSILKSPQNLHFLENIALMEEQFKGLNNSFFLNNPSVYYTVIDMYGNIYTSYWPGKPLDAGQLSQHPGFVQLLEQGGLFQWLPNDSNYVFHDLTTSPSLLSMYAVIRERDQPYGLVRISIDYAHWFRSALFSNGDYQDFYILNGRGEQVAQTAVQRELPREVINQVLAHGSPNSYLIDHESEALINFTYLESLDWYMVNRIPLTILYTEIEALKQNAYMTFFLCTIAFISIAFAISYMITRPLSRVQKKMKQAVRHDLSLRLSEHEYSGEVKELAETFNTILNDLNQIIERLKMEEKQKDAVHFQMLLAQMNPHFLLNTLNTMKWISLRQGQQQIADICISLGKLLEKSLNAEIDLICLKEEMELIQAFVYIQQIRYNHRFQVLIDNELQEDYVLVPKFSLQPLVENAIKYGIAHERNDGVITIRIRRHENKSLLVLEVEDNGIGFERAMQKEKKPKREGIGLNNIRKRLSLLFKEDGELTIIPLARGSLVRITLPLLVSTPYSPFRQE